MKTYRRTATLVGLAYLFSNVTFILGAIVMVEAILGSPDYLSLISAGRAQIVLGVLFCFANGLAYVGIAALLFPVLKPRFESLASRAETNSKSARQPMAANVMSGLIIVESVVLQHK